MGDLKVSEGFLDAVMIRKAMDGTAATGLVPTCTVMKLSDGTTVGLTVAELTLGVYKATDWTPNADTEYITIWTVVGAYVIYVAYKLFKVGGGRIEDVHDLIKTGGSGGYFLDIDLDHLLKTAHPSGDPVADTIFDLIMNKGAGQTFNRATDSLEFLGETAASILADTVTIAWGDITTIDGLIDDIIADIGVFPTANYATLAAYVEDMRSKAITVDGLHDVPGQDAITNAQMRDVIGNKTDTPAGSITGTFSLMRYIKMLVTDWLNGGRLDVIIDAIKTATDKLTGADTGASFSYLDAGGEQTVFTIAIGTRTKLSSLFLDLNTLTQNTTIRVKQQIDGANYRTFSKIKWLVATDDKGVYFLGELPVTENIQVTMEEVADEGAVRAIPYYYITEAME